MTSSEKEKIIITLGEISDNMEYKSGFVRKVEDKVCGGKNDFIYSVCGVLFAFYISNSTGII